MPDEGPFQGGSCWLDSLLYDDGQWAFRNWPDEHQLMPLARLPVIRWLLRKPSDEVSVSSRRFW